MKFYSILLIVLFSLLSACFLDSTDSESPEGGTVSSSDLSSTEISSSALRSEMSSGESQSNTSDGSDNSSSETVDHSSSSIEGHNGGDGLNPGGDSSLSDQAGVSSSQEYRTFSSMSTPVSTFSSPASDEIKQLKLNYLAAKKIYDAATSGDWKCESAECIETLAGWQTALDALQGEVSKLSFSKSVQFHNEYDITSSTESSITYTSKSFWCSSKTDENDMNYIESTLEEYDITANYSIENGVLDWKTIGDDCDISYYAGASRSIMGTWNYTGTGSIADLNDACDYVYPNSKIMNVTGTLKADNEMVVIDSKIEYNCWVDDVIWEQFVDQEFDAGEGVDIIIDCNSWYRMYKGMKTTTIRDYHETFTEFSRVYSVNGKSCTTSSTYPNSLNEELDCSITDDDRAFNDCMQDMLGEYCEFIAPDDRPYKCDQFSDGYFDNAMWL